MGPEPVEHRVRIRTDGRGLQREVGDRTGWAASGDVARRDTNGHADSRCPQSSPGTVHRCRSSCRRRCPSGLPRRSYFRWWRYRRCRTCRRCSCRDTRRTRSHRICSGKRVDLVDHVAHQAVPERDVGAGADAYVAIAFGLVAQNAVRLFRGSITMSLAAFLDAGIRGCEELLGEAGTADVCDARGVVLGRVSSPYDDVRRVGDVGPMVRHRATSECGGQTGHRGPVSYTGLMLDVAGTEVRDRSCGRCSSARCSCATNPGTRRSSGCTSPVLSAPLAVTRLAAISAMALSRLVLLHAPSPIRL